MKNLAFTFFLLFIIVLPSCKTNINEPRKQGEYTLSVSVPSFADQIHSSNARMISGNYEITPSAHFVFSWSVDDVIKIIRYNKDGNQVGDVIEHPVSSSSTNPIQIDVDLSNTHHFIVKCGPDKVPNNQIYSMNKISDEMLLFQQEICLDTISSSTIDVTLKAQWPVLLVSPTYDFSVPEDIPSTDDVLFTVAVNKIEVIQYFSNEEKYTMSYYKTSSKTGKQTPISSTVQGGSVVTPFPIVVHPTINRKCSLQIKIDFDDNGFVAKYDGDDLIPSEEIGVVTMQTNTTTPNVELISGEAASFVLKPEKCAITWIWK